MRFSREAKGTLIKRKRAGKYKEIFSCDWFSSDADWLSGDTGFLDQSKRLETESIPNYFVH